MKESNRYLKDCGQIYQDYVSVPSSFDNLGGNLVRFAGCSAIAGSNWKQLEEIDVCYYFDETGTIDVLNLVATNWAAKCKVECLFVAADNLEEE